MKSSKPWLYAAARVFDGIARAALRRAPRPLPEHPRRILVSNIGHLGDALLSFGVPRVLRGATGASVDVLVSSDGARLFQGHPDVDRVFVHDALLLRRGASREGVYRNGANASGRLIERLRDREYDVAIELRSYVPNSIPLLARVGAAHLCGFGSAGFSFMLDRVVPHVDGEHELQRFGRVLGVVLERAGPGIVPFPCLRHLAAAGNGRNGRPPYVVLHPGTRRRRKRWPVDRWRRLADALAGSGRSVVITGAETERRWLEDAFGSLPAEILTGSLDVPALASLYGHATAFVGVDSFPAHLAAIAGTPHVVVLWHDHADPAEWAPVGDGRISVLPGGSSHDSVLRLLAEPV